MANLPLIVVVQVQVHSTQDVTICDLCVSQQIKLIPLSGRVSFNTSSDVFSFQIKKCKQVIQKQNLTVEHRKLFLSIGSTEINLPKPGNTFKVFRKTINMFYEDGGENLS